MGVVIIPEDPDDEWDLEEWKEVMGSQKPGGAAAFSLAMSEHVYVIQVHANQVRSCLRQLLGYAWADAVAPYQLHREAVPVQDPQFPWLYADSVAVNFKTPLGTALDGTLEGKAKVSGVGFSSRNYSPEYYGRYGDAEVTVRFRPVNYRLFLDADITWSEGYAGKEWMRNFGPMGKQVALDLITAEGGSDDASLYFAEGGGTGPVSGPSGTPFGGTQFVRVSKTVFRMIWKCVPLAYTSGEFQFTEAEIGSFLMPLPERLSVGLGRVNSTPFPGSASRHKAGTLLLSAVEEIPYQQPVRTDSDFGLWAADYILTFEHLDPKRDSSAVQNLGGGGAVDVKYGHHLYPWRKTRKFYYATAGSSTTKGTYAGKGQLGQQDFHNLFRHVNDTDAVTGFPLPTEDD